jgi:uncharacterized protein
MRIADLVARLHSGEHVGSAVIRAFFEREEPDLVLCGHTHESRGTDTIARARTPTPGRPPLGTTRSWR